MKTSYLYDQYIQADKYLQKFIHTRHVLLVVLFTHKIRGRLSNVHHHHHHYHHHHHHSLTIKCQTKTKFAYLIKDIYISMSIAITFIFTGGYIFIPINYKGHNIYSYVYNSIKDIYSISTKISHSYSYSKTHRRHLYTAFYKEDILYIRTLFISDVD